MTIYYHGHKIEWYGCILWIDEKKVEGYRFSCWLDAYEYVKYNVM